MKLLCFQFGGNPVSCAIGLAVLDVIRNEQLMSSAKFVGRILLERFCNIMDKHPMIGQVRLESLAIAQHAHAAFNTSNV